MILFGTISSLLVLGRFNYSKRIALVVAMPMSMSLLSIDSVLLCIVMAIDMLMSLESSCVHHLCSTSAIHWVFLWFGQTYLPRRVKKPNSSRICKQKSTGVGSFPRQNDTNFKLASPDHTKTACFAHVCPTQVKMVLVVYHLMLEYIHQRLALLEWEPADTMVLIAKSCTGSCTPFRLFIQGWALLFIIIISLSLLTYTWQVQPSHTIIEWTC